MLLVMGAFCTQYLLQGTITSIYNGRRHGVFCFVGDAHELSWKRWMAAVPYETGGEEAKRS